MKNIKKFLLWGCLLNKRLLKKISFIVIISLIPILVLAMALVAREDGGILKIVLCAEDATDEIASEIIDKLTTGGGVLNFETVSDPDEAYEYVKLGKADAAWIFVANMRDKIDAYVSSSAKKSPFVTVIERENDVTLQLSHEKLYGTLFSYISYSLFRGFMYSEVFEFEEISEEDMKDAYGAAVGGGDLVVSEKLGGIKNETQSNYLTAPLRGLLSLVVLLCGLSAVMYYQTDKANGVYDWLSSEKHIIPGSATCCAAIFDACIAVLVALKVSGLFTSLITEVSAALSYVPAAAGFCMVIGVLTRKSARTGQIVPFVMIIALAISPIFFNLKSLSGLQAFLPTYYYLYAIYDPTYLLYAAAYSVAAFGLVILLNRALERN